MALLPRIYVMEERSEVPKYIKVERKSYHTLYECYYLKKLNDNCSIEMLEGEDSYWYLFDKFKNKGKIKQKNHYGSACVSPI